jgi:hypothetical protein
MKGFNFETYNGLNDKEKGIYILDFKKEQFMKLFDWKGDLSSDEFHKACSSDRKVLKWLKKLNMEIMLITTSPLYTNVDDCPDEVRGLILIDKANYEKLESDLRVDLKKMNDQWEKSEKELLKKRHEGIKGLSNYFLVTTIEIKDVPLSRKRKMITLESKGDVTSLELAGLERKGIVQEFKKELFSILVKNGGVFPEGYENPFMEKFQA